MILLLLLALTAAMHAESITFTFANGQVTNDGTYKYYEFDVMAQGAEGNTQVGDLMIYINYNTDAFGTLVKTNLNITVTMGTLVQGALYSSTVNDNTASRVAVATEYLVPATPSMANLLPSTPTQYVHVKLKIQNDSQTAGLSFQQSLMTGQQYLSNNETKYNPVIATDTDNSNLNPIAVELASFTAKAQGGAVLLEWQTASESDHAGFNVFRSAEASGTYERLNESLIPAMGQTTAGATYRFVDLQPFSGVNFYKLQDVSLSGQTSFSAVISITTTAVAEKPALPEDFDLKQNYPNPFNPETRIEYQLPSDAAVELGIYNLSGQLIRSLVSEHKPAGFYAALWNGRDDGGQAVGSGIYLMRLKAGDYTSTRRITLLR